MIKAEVSTWSCLSGLTKAGITICDSLAHVPVFKWPQIVAGISIHPSAPQHVVAVGPMLAPVVSDPVVELNQLVVQ